MRQLTLLTVTAIVAFPTAAFAVDTPLSAEAFADQIIAAIDVSRDIDSVRRLPRDSHLAHWVEKADEKTLVRAMSELAREIRAGDNTETFNSATKMTTRGRTALRALEYLTVRYREVHLGQPHTNSGQIGALQKAQGLLANRFKLWRAGWRRSRGFVWDGEQRREFPAGYERRHVYNESENNLSHNWISPGGNARIRSQVGGGWQRLNIELGEGARVGLNAMSDALGRDYFNVVFTERLSSTQRRERSHPSFAYGDTTTFDEATGTRVYRSMPDGKPHTWDDSRFAERLRAAKKGRRGLRGLIPRRN